jgi:hypothetical protein
MVVLNSLFVIFCAFSNSLAYRLPYATYTNHIRSPTKIYRRPSNQQTSRTSLYGIVSQKWANDEGDRRKSLARVDNNTDSEEPESSDGFENQPEWLELFPPRKPGSKPEVEREYPDFANLPPDDPLFLDMPWPTEAGPEASAFGRHMQWRRSLTDGERTYQSIRE